MFPAFVVLLSIVLYIPESCQKSLLLATDSGINTLSLTSSTLTNICNHSAQAVAFRYHSRDVFFVSNSNHEIFYSFYSNYFQRLSEPTPRVVSPYPLTSLAVDWVSYKIYYGHQGGALIKETLSVSNKTTVNPEGLVVLNMALDPYERLIFFHSQGHLYSVSLNIDVPSQHDIKDINVTGLALDLHSKQVYVVGVRDTQWVLSVKGYDTKTYDWDTPVYVGNELKGVKALTVYSGILIWASQCGDFHCLYTCQRDACGDTLAIVWRTFEVINDVKYYTPLVQTPDTQTACLMCSHSCQNGTAECACPEDMEVAEDGVKCIDKPASLGRQIQDLLEGLLGSCYQWLSDSRTYLYTCGGLFLALILCCVCLMCTVPCSDPVIEEDDEFHLSEVQQGPSRHTRRSNI